MKVAILMSGLMYSYKHTYKTIIENLLQKYDCDIFIYTTTKNKIKGSKHSLQIDEMEKEEIKTIFAPYLKNIIFSEDDETYQDEFKTFSNQYLEQIKNFTYDTEACYYYGPAHVRQVDQYFRLYKAFLMMESYLNEMKTNNNNIDNNNNLDNNNLDNNFKYDAIIRCRPDEHINQEIVLKEINDNTLYVLGPPHGIKGCIDINFVCEHFFYGSYNTFKKFCFDFVNTYGSYQTLSVLKLNKTTTITLSPEAQFTQWCKCNNVTMEWNNYDYACKYDEKHDYLIEKTQDNPLGKLMYYSIIK